MGCSQEAISLFEKYREENTLTQAVWFAPGESNKSSAKIQSMRDFGHPQYLVSCILDCSPCSPYYYLNVAILR